MRSVKCIIVICLLNFTFLKVAFGHVQPFNFQIKYYPIKCLDETRNRGTNVQHESKIHIDCSAQRSSIPCSDHNVSRTDIFNWLSRFYQNVTSLYLESNCITELLAIPYLPNLTLLNYKYNKIKWIEDEAFKNVPSLENLDLSHNQIAELKPGIFNSNLSIGQLAIKSLHLGYNKIKSLNYQTFEQLSLLQELHLDGNQLGVIDPSAAMTLKYISGKSLQVLNLAKTGISSFPVYSLKGSKLRALYLNGNNFCKVPPELIHLKDTLEFLNINGNPITVLNSESFFALNHLREIVASGMKNLTDVNGGTFLHLKSLQKLTLSFNHKLSFIDRNAFCIDSCRPSHSAIKVVYLNNNNLHYISEDLLPWNQLDELLLTNNPWICDWKNEWMKKLNREFLNDNFVICLWSPKTHSNDCNEKSDCDRHTSGNERKIRQFVTFFIGVLSVFVLAGILFFIGLFGAKLIPKYCFRLNRMFVEDPEIKVFTSSFHYNKLINKPSYAV